MSAELDLIRMRFGYPLRVLFHFSYACPGCSKPVVMVCRECKPVALERGWRPGFCAEPIKRKT